MTPIEACKKVKEKYEDELEKINISIETLTAKYQIYHIEKDILDSMYMKGAYIETQYNLANNEDARLYEEITKLKDDKETVKRIIDAIDTRILQITDDAN